MSIPGPGVCVSHQAASSSPSANAGAPSRLLTPVMAATRAAARSSGVKRLAFGAASSSGISARGQ